jgi:hypothetical protein
MFNNVISGEEDKIICYCGDCDEYGILVPDGGPSFVPMNYCPWCGGKFPASKRDLLYDVLQLLGYSGFFDEEIPSILNTDEWHKSLPDVDGMTPQKIIKELGLKPKPEKSR